MKNEFTNKMKKGDVKILTKGDQLCAMVWMDKRKVSVLSTGITPGMTSLRRTGKRGIQEEFTKPDPIIEYNKSMIGVDLSDQLRSYYELGRRSVKWWRYIFHFILNTSLCNANILYKAANRPHPSAHSERSLCQPQFRMDVASALVAGNVLKGKRRASFTATSSAGLGSTLSADHQSVRLFGRKKACVWCAKLQKKTPKGRTPETVNGCNLCKIHICKGLCFAAHHAELAKMQTN